MTFIIYGVMIVVIVLVLKKYSSQINALINPGHGSTGGVNPDQSLVLKKLADDLGFDFKENEKIDDPKVIQQGSYELNGEYKDIPVTLIYSWYSKEDHKMIDGKLTRILEYSIDNRVILKTGTSGEWKILPKDSAQSGMKTGHEVFDQHFDYLGDSLKLSSDQLEKISQFSWIHLNLKDGKLTLVDDFMSWYQEKNGPQSMMSAVHPLWNTSATNTIVEADKIRAFLDKMISLC